MRAPGGDRDLYAEQFTGERPDFPRDYRRVVLTMRLPPGIIPIAQLRQVVTVPVVGTRLCAGFPSPADDYVEAALDPTSLIMTNPTATFMWRVAGISMVRAGINDGDYVVVDRSLVPRAGDAVVAIIDGLPSAKRIVRVDGRLALDFADAAMTPLVLDEASEALIWGVVTWSLTEHRRLVR